MGLRTPLVVFRLNKLVVLYTVCRMSEHCDAFYILYVSVLYSMCLVLFFFTTEMCVVLLCSEKDCGFYVWVSVVICHIAYNILYICAWYCYFSPQRCSAIMLCFRGAVRSCYGKHIMAFVFPPRPQKLLTMFSLTELVRRTCKRC